MKLAEKIPHTSRRLWCHRCGWTSWNDITVRPNAGDTCPQCRAHGPQHTAGAVLRWVQVTIDQVEPLPTDVEALF